VTGSWWTTPDVQQDRAAFARAVKAHEPQISNGPSGQRSSLTLGDVGPGWPRLTRAQRKRRDKERAG
jgi:hypothetical protein